jgi:hypothetical protein
MALCSVVLFLAPCLWCPSNAMRACVRPVVVVLVVKWPGQASGGYI